jgi:DNA modification methylase
MIQGSDENAMPATQVEAIVRLPFEPFYDQDGITIYNADCRDVLLLIPSVDLLLTDPPYGIGYGGKKNSVGGSDGRHKARWKTWETDWDEKPVDADLLSGLVSRASDSIVWGGNYFVLPPSQGWLVWDKGQRDFTLADAELAWTSRDKATRVFTYTRPAALAEGPRIHPTQKPLALMRWCLGLVPEAQTVLDPFMGSGTTLLAAKLEGRKAVGIEINRTYCEAAVNRLKQKTLW